MASAGTLCGQAFVWEPEGSVQIAALLPPRGKARGGSKAAI
jgi:hypothetical protein